MKDYCNYTCPQWDQANETCKAMDLLETDPNAFEDICPAYNNKEIANMHDDE